jgi:hypothetical protein
VFRLRRWLAQLRLVGPAVAPFLPGREMTETGRAPVEAEGELAAVQA